MSRRRAAATLAALLLLATLGWLATRGEPAPTPPPVRGGAPPQPSPRPAPAPIRAPAPAPADAAGSALRVRVVDDLGRPDPAGWAEAVDCPGLRAAPSPEEGVLVYRADPGACVVRAARADGLARTVGPVVRAEVPERGIVDVSLVIPSARTGGVQLAFQPVDDGIRLMWVPAGSDLERAGVARGDRILAVGGESLAGLDPADVREALTGAEGTEVRLEVLRSGDTGAEPEVLVLRHTVVEPE